MFHPGLSWAEVKLTFVKVFWLATVPLLLTSMSGKLAPQGLVVNWRRHEGAG